MDLQNTDINIEDMKYFLEKVRQFGFHCNESAKEVSVYLTSSRTRNTEGLNWKDIQSEVLKIMEHFKGVFDPLYKDVLDYASVGFTNTNDLNPETQKKKLNMSLIRNSDDDEYTFDSDSNILVPDGVPEVAVKKEDTDNLGRTSPTPSVSSTIILDVDTYNNIDFDQEEDEEETDNISVTSDVDNESEESYVFDFSNFDRNTYDNDVDQSLPINTALQDRLHIECIIDDVKDEANSFETEKLSYVEPSDEYENSLCHESTLSETNIQPNDEICNEKEIMSNVDENLHNDEDGEKLSDAVDLANSDSSDSYIKLSKLDEPEELTEVLKLGDESSNDQTQHAGLYDNVNKEHKADQINFLAYLGLKPTVSTENNQSIPLPQEYNTRQTRKKHQDANDIFRKLLNLRDTDSEISSDHDSTTNESSDGESGDIEDNSEFGSLFDSDIEHMDSSMEEDASVDLCSDKEKHKLIECSISLTKMTDEEILTITKETSNEPNVDRLCDINNVNKRRRSLDDDLPTVKKKRKHSITDKENSPVQECNNQSSGVENMQADTFSLLHSDDEINKEESFAINKEEAFAELICENIEVIDSDCSEESNNNLANGKGKGSANKTVEKKRKLSPEEREKTKWKDDPLLCLRGLLTDINDLNTKVNCSLNESNDNNTKIELISSESSDCESVSSDGKEIEAKKKKVERHLKKVRRSSDLSCTSLSSDSESEDSEIEFVEVPEKTKTNIDSLSASQGSKLGRKNIRQVMDDEDLAEATKEARKEEERRILRLESGSNSFAELEEDKIVLEMDKNEKPIVTIDPKLGNRLKPHQRSGVAFMWESCFESVEHFKTTEGSGCILAHCMGLGKTFQVIALMHTLFTHESLNFNHALVVCPLSTVKNWQNEFKIGLKNIENKFKINLFIIGEKKHDKISSVKRWWKNKGVLILGYEAYENLTNGTKTHDISSKELIEEALINPGPQLIVCDEGHLLKNGKTLRTKALMKVKTKRRIVLTGTPLQNNLKEYYHMVQFVKPNLLGTFKEYKNTFVNPIENGQYDDSSIQDIRRMKQRTHVLHKLLKRAIQRVEVGELKKYLNDIHDYALFVELSDNQINLYTEYLKNVRPEGDDQITQKKQFLRDIQQLGLICSHPYLLFLSEDHLKKKKHIVEYDTIDSINADILKPGNIPSKWYVPFCPEDVKDKVEYGHKYIVMQSIIEEAEKIGDKVLLFSHSLIELDAIEHFLKTVGTSSCKSWSQNYDYYRMDGTVPPTIRTALCDIFNDPENTRGRLFMMSYRVGGLGLNLTAANRVILMGANFNPSHDTQGIYRAYRFGQTKPCYVYRLLTLGTMEEIIYKRCITKLAQAGRVIDKYQIDRHYNRKHITELYITLPERKIDRPTPIVPVDDDLLAKVLQRNKVIYNYHQHEALLENRPEEALTEAEKNSAWEEFNRKDEVGVRPAAIMNQFPNNVNMKFQPGSNVDQIKQLLLGAVAANNKPLLDDLMKMINTGVAGCNKEEAIMMINSATELQRRGIQVNASGQLFIPNVCRTNVPSCSIGVPMYISHMGKQNFVQETKLLNSTTIEATNTNKLASTQTVIDRSIPTSSQNSVGISGHILQNMAMTGQQNNIANKSTLPSSTIVSGYKIPKVGILGINTKQEKRGIHIHSVTSNVPGYSVPLSQQTKSPHVDITVTNSNVSITSGLSIYPTAVTSISSVPTYSTANMSKQNVTDLSNNKDSTLTHATSEAKQVRNMNNIFSKAVPKGTTSSERNQELSSAKILNNSEKVVHKPVINITENTANKSKLNKMTIRKNGEGNWQSPQRINPIALQKRNVIPPSKYTENMVSVFSRPATGKEVLPNLQILPCNIRKIATPHPVAEKEVQPNLQSIPHNIRKVTTSHPVTEKEVLSNLQSMPCNIRKITIPSTNLIPNDPSSDTLVHSSITKSTGPYSITTKSSAEAGKVAKKKKNSEAQASQILYRGSKSIRKENTSNNILSDLIKNYSRNKLHKTNGIPHQVAPVRDHQAPISRVIRKHKNPLQESTVNSDGSTLLQKEDNSSPQVSKNRPNSNVGNLKIVNVNSVNNIPEDDIVFVSEKLVSEKEKIFTTLKRNGVVRVSPKSKSLDDMVASKEK